MKIRNLIIGVIVYTLTMTALFVFGGARMASAATTYSYSTVCSGWHWVGGTKQVAGKGCVQVRRASGTSTTWTRVRAYFKCAPGYTGKHVYVSPTVYLTDRGNGHLKITYPIMNGSGEFTPHPACGTTLSSVWTLTYTSSGRVEHGHVAVDVNAARNDRYSPNTRLATGWLVF